MGCNIYCLHDLGLFRSKTNIKFSLFDSYLQLVKQSGAKQILNPQLSYFIFKAITSQFQKKTVGIIC